MVSPVVVALDFDSEEKVLSFVEKLNPQQCRLKVGKEIFTRCGPQLVEHLQQQGFDIFLDLKFHDIPNTVASAVAVAADLGVWMVNVHACGGRRMLEAAANALSAYQQPPLLIGVTVLTSMVQQDLLEIGISNSPAEQVLRLAALVDDSGLDGVVCSAHEAETLRAERGDSFCLVTPGIRLLGDDPGDQRRVVTPEAAISKGSDYLVIGRSISGSDDPARTLAEVNASLV
jgi:orotidine-5'-phosphate decarboxylase